jgi:Uri superfamily endonuclease
MIVAEVMRDVCVCVCGCSDCICSTVLYLFCNKPSQLLLAVQQNANTEVQELLNSLQHSI